MCHPSTCFSIHDPLWWASFVILDQDFINIYPLTAGTMVSFVSRGFWRETLQEEGVPLPGPGVLSTLLLCDGLGVVGAGVLGCSSRGACPELCSHWLFITTSQRWQLVNSDPTACQGFLESPFPLTRSSALCWGPTAQPADPQILSWWIYLPYHFHSVPVRV